MKLDAELIEELVEAMKQGLPIDIACDYVEINRSTFFRWQKEAKKLYDKLGQGRKNTELTNATTEKLG